MFIYLHKQLEDLRQQLQEARQKTEELNQEQIALIDMLQEETERHNQAEEGLKEKLRVRTNFFILHYIIFQLIINLSLIPCSSPILQDAANTIAKLVEKVKLLEGRK